MIDPNLSGYDRIYVANVAEAFESVLLTITDPQERRTRVSREHTLSQRALFWEGHRRVVITQLPISPELIRYGRVIFSGSDILNLSTNSNDIDLCNTLQCNASLWSDLRSIINSNPGISLTPYAVTRHFLALVKRLRDEGLSFTVPDVPPPGAEWTISYLDSKSGFRSELLTNWRVIPEFKIPRGFICSNVKEASEIAAWLYSNNASCVIKADRGESGWGILMVRDDVVSVESDLKNQLEIRLGTDEIWKHGPIVVEEYINAASDRQMASPSVELYITEHGPQINYICQQVIGLDGEFFGIILGKNAVDDYILERLQKIAMLVGIKYWELGYRGFFDLDCILSRDDSIYLLETNMRRTGGTHVFDLAQRLFGPDWHTRCWMFSNDSFCYGNTLLSTRAIFDRLDYLLFPINGESRGVLITSISNFEPIFGYVIVAASKDEGQQLRKELLARWCGEGQN